MPASFAITDVGGGEQLIEEIPGKALVLIYGYSHNENCLGMLDAAFQKAREKDIDCQVVFLGLNEAEVNISKLSSSYPGVLLSPGSKANEGIYSKLYRDCGHTEERMYIPCVFVLDENRHIRYLGTGLHEKELTAAIQELGYRPAPTNAPSATPSPTPAVFWQKTDVQKTVEFIDMNGKKRRTDEFRGKSVVLMYGRSTAADCIKMLKAGIENITKMGISSQVIFLGINAEDTGISSLAAANPEVIFSPGSNENREVYWGILKELGSKVKKVHLPGIFFLDPEGHIRCFGTGLHEEELKSAMAEYSPKTTPTPTAAAGPTPTPVVLWQKANVQKTVEFEDLSGRARSTSEFLGQGVLLLYGRSYGSKCVQMLKAAVEKTRQSSIRCQVVYLGIDTADTEFSKIISEYGEVIYSAPSQKNKEQYTEVRRACGISSMKYYYLPVTILIDPRGYVRYFGTDLHKDELLSAMDELFTVAGSPTPTPAPTPVPARLTVNRSQVTLYKGSSQKKFTLQTSLTGASGTISFKSSNTSVAKVLEAGVITAKKAGTATITAYLSSDSRVYAQCRVTVLNPTLSIGYVSVSMRKGGKFTLIAYATPAAKITFKSSNKKVATVNSAGLVKGKKKGTAYITVTANKVSKKCKVKVS